MIATLKKEQNPAYAFIVMLNEINDLPKLEEILNFVQYDKDKVILTANIMKKFTYKNLLIFLLTASVLALSLAYISQYFFGMEPCILCFYQRKPFFAVIILSVIALAIPKLRNQQKLFARIAVLLILINSFIALYHSGVERKIFKGPNTCSASNINPNNLEELKQILSTTKAVRCDQPQFVFLNLSMADWNVVYCLFLVVTSLVILRKIKSL